MSEVHLDRMSFVRGTQAGRKGGRQAGRYLAVLIRELLGEEQKKKKKTDCSCCNNSCLSVQH